MFGRVCLVSCLLIRFLGCLDAVVGKSSLGVYRGKRLPVGFFFFLRLYVSYAVVVVFVMVGISIDCLQHNLLNISVNMEKLRTLL